VSPPPLAEMLRWVASMPAPFRAAPEGFSGGNVRVRAVVADLFESLQGDPPSPVLLAAFEPARDAVDSNRLRWVLAVAHLLWHPYFRRHPPPREALERFLVQEVARLAGVVNVDRLQHEEERREEIVRRAFRAFGLSFDGESPEDAEDQFRQVDSIERRRLLLSAAQRERRAREIRETMARRAAQEAAAKVSRE